MVNGGGGQKMPASRGGAESRRVYDGWWAKREPRSGSSEGRWWSCIRTQAAVSRSSKGGWWWVLLGECQTVMDNCPSPSESSEGGGGGVWQCSPSRVRATERWVIDNKNEPKRGYTLLLLAV